MISIIVPLYNVEAYISQCLNSLLSIKDVDYEIIIVNDGSKDASIDIVNQCISPKIRVINQDNSGLAAARNTGLRHALGDYVAFIDSDDFIDPEQFKALCSNIKENVDIVVGEFYFYSEREVKPNRVISKVNFISTGKEVLSKYSKIYSPVAWRSIYKTSFLKKYMLYFTEGIFFEDADWTPRVLYYATKVSYVNIPFYYYRQRIGSIMKTDYNYKKFKDNLFIALHLITFVEDEVDKNIYNIFLYNSFYSLCVGIGKYCRYNSLDRSDEQNIIAIMNGIWPITSLRVKLLILLYRYFPNIVKALLVCKYS